MTWLRNFCLSILGPLALLLLIVAPSQTAFKLYGAYVTPADLILAVAFPVALFTGRMRIKTLPFANCAFVGLALVSCLFSDMFGESLKEWIQFFLYFVIGERVADTALSVGGEKWRRRGIAAFVAVGVVIVGVAMWQYFFEAADNPLNVRGTFGNRNVFGGYLALLIPFSAAYIGPFDRRNALKNTLLLFLVAGAFFVCLSGAALIAIVVSVLVLARAKGWPAMAVAAAALLSAAIWIAPATPRDNLTTIIKSIAHYDIDNGEPTRRYPEWDAAVSMALERPWCGVGPGTYRHKIGAYYDSIPRATGPSEPDIQNLYLVLASTLGIPALLAFFLMLLPRSCVATDAASLALLAFMIASIWNPLLVRGIGLPLVFVMAMRKTCET